MSDNLTENLNDSQDTKIDRLIIAVQSIDSRLASLETKVDQRLHDTQTIWEAVQAQLSEIRDTTEKGFRTIDRRMERQIGEFERLHAYQRDLEDRVDRIEKLQNP